MKKFSWDLGAYCNYKCSYCFFSISGWQNLEAKQAKVRSPEELESAWKYIYNKYGKCYIYITGGEPFLYPKFNEIVSKITKFHQLHITTNLSQNLDKFLKIADPEKVEINSTFHPMHAGYKEFGFQLVRLQKEGFKCGLCYLAHPSQLKEMLNYKKYFLNLGFSMAITVFWGDYNKVSYPQGYTEKDRAYIEFVSKWSSEKDDYTFLVENISNNLNELSENDSNLKPKVVSGISCKAGYEYATIGLDGFINPCGQLQEPILGNIFAMDIALLNAPFTCKAVYCKNRESEYSL